MKKVWMRVRNLLGEFASPDDIKPKPGGGVRQHLVEMVAKKGGKKKG